MHSTIKTTILFGSLFIAPSISYAEIFDCTFNDFCVTGEECLDVSGNGGLAFDVRETEFLISPNGINGFNDGARFDAEITRENGEIRVSFVVSETTTRTLEISSDLKVVVGNIEGGETSSLLYGSCTDEGN